MYGKQILEITKAAEKYGITTLDQLKVFCLHCEDKPVTMLQALKIKDTKDPRYIKHARILRKLVKTGYRDDDLDLLMTEKGEGKGKVYVVKLTKKVRMPAKKIQDVCMKYSN